MIINLVYVNKYNTQDINTFSYFVFSGLFAPNGRIVTHNYICIVILFCNAYKFSQS